MELLWKALLSLQLIQAITVCLLSSFSYQHCEEGRDAFKQDIQWGTKHHCQVSTFKSRGHFVQGSGQAGGRVPGRKLPVAEVSVASVGAEVLGVQTLPEW